MRLWLIVALPLYIVLGLLATYRTGYVHGSDMTHAKWDAEKLTLITAQRTKEADLQSNMDTLRKAYTDETSRLATTVHTLTVSMRNRPERPTMPSSASSSPGSAPQGCTGATIYRSDSEFLVRLAERADTIRLALIQCQSAYQEASKN